MYVCVVMLSIICECVLYRMCSLLSIICTYVCMHAYMYVCIVHTHTHTHTTQYLATESGND